MSSDVGCRDDEKKKRGDEELDEQWRSEDEKKKERNKRGERGDKGKEYRK